MPIFNDHDSFEKLMAFIYDAEGYASNDPKDPGGLTIYGVSTHWYPSEVSAMRTMTKEEAWAYAKDFYYQEFWLKAHCDAIIWPANVCVGDMAINQGQMRAFNLWTSSGNSWQHFLLKRLRMYGDTKGGDPVLHGHMDRVLNLFDNIESFEKG